MTHLAPWTSKLLGASGVCTATPTLRGAVPPVDLRAVAVVQGMEYLFGTQEAKR